MHSVCLDVDATKSNERLFSKPRCSQSVRVKYLVLELEILQEILHYDSSLRIWFDRDISFEVGGDLSVDIVSLPRLVTSRSHEKQKEDSRLISKQSVKLGVVERAAFNIGRG